MATRVSEHLVRSVLPCAAAALLCAHAAFAQEETPPEETQTAPQEQPASPPEGEAAPTETIPVQTGEAEQAPESTALDTVEVTGSRIRRADYETAQPVLVVTREDIEKTGLLSVGDILQNLPQAGAALSRAFNNGGNGATEVDLRNLGSNRVLVLVNGRRWVGGVSQFNTNGVDLNTIPTSIIDSIEVLKDGASAVYGSDAIAGVINIKTRRDFVGAETRAHFDATDTGDGPQQQVNLSAGSVAGKTSIFFDVNYVNQGPLYSGDRDESSVPTYGTGITRGSGNSPFGKAIFVTTPSNADAINAAAGTPSGPTATCYDITAGVAAGVGEVDNPIGEVPFPAGVILCDWTLDRDALASGNHVFTRYDRNVHSYNYAAGQQNYLITPQERTSIFGQLSHQLTDAIRLSSDVLYNVRKSSQQLAPTPVPIVGDALGSFNSFAPFSTVYVDATNPYNPLNSASPYYIPGTTAHHLARSADGAGSPTAGYGAVNIRFNDLGPRLFSQNVDTMRIGLGLDGDFEGLDRIFSWDGGYIFGESKLTDVNAGLVNMERMARALGPLDQCVPTDSSVADPNAAGCVPLDVFGGPGAITQEMLDYIKYTAIDFAYQRQRGVYLNLSTEFTEAEAFLPGPIGVAIGAEAREEFYRGVPDPLKQASLSSTNAEQSTVGEYTAREAYFELAVPLLADLPFVNEMDVSIAGRYSKYSGFGDNFSGKFGLRYKPIESLLVRGTISDAFRAPAIGDLYQGQATGYPEVQDICNGRDSDPARANEVGIENVRANCSADGVPDDVSSGGQVATTFGGNPELEPETARTLSFGLVWSPDFITDFSATVDWYKIELDEFIGGVSDSIIQDLCYRSDPDARVFCDKLLRETADDRQIVRVFAVSDNYAGLEVEGVDANIQWTLPFEFLRPFGSFKADLDIAYVTKFAAIFPTGLGETTQELQGQEVAGFQGYPRLKANGGISWLSGPWTAGWEVRYIHRLTEPCDDGLSDPGAAAGGSNPTPVPSFAEFGICSDPDAPGGATNELDATVYNDVHGSFTYDPWSTKIAVGVNNVLNQDPPRAVSAFANSFDVSTHEFWGSRTPYLSLQVNF